MLNIKDLLKKSGLKSQVVSKEKEDTLKEKLTEIKIKEIEEEVTQKAQQLGVPYISLVGFPISPEALRLISLENARHYKLVCFYRTEKEAKLASMQLENKNPDLKKFRQQIEVDYDLKTELYLISEHSFDFMERRYASLPKISKVEKGLKITAEEFKGFKDKIKTFKDLNQQIQKTSVSDLLTLIMASAVQSRASDIHIEAEEKDVKIRFRIDGILITVAEIDKKFWSQIVSRIKLLSGLKLNVVDRPQDGRFRIDLTDDRIDIRVSSLPTSYGESIVMRLLRSSSVGLGFNDLGFRKEAYALLKREIERPNGMILTTGPTGSGKTTTLYAILNKLNSPETKIITLEDPIEYHLKGVNQSQVDKSKDYTFAKGLRSILRQDPDIVMIGEIRDLETADIALQAALTGHLVVSTLHTNDAAGALPRFLGMGVKPYLLSPAINAIIGQRLARLICKKCKREITLEKDILERVQKILLEIPEKSGIKVDLKKLKFYQGQGCDECQGLGYHGRVGIYEVFAIDPEIEKAVLSSELSEYKIKELTQKQGMITMIQDGLLKATEGSTTVEEIFRIIE
ncbi:type II/IV secretion system protein [Patescibacteria group bacterium]|nr:type II/IV secretion system protein [Patescibacteria group bacterium]